MDGFLSLEIVEATTIQLEYVRIFIPSMCVPRQEYMKSSVCTLHSCEIDKYITAL